MTRVPVITGQLIVALSVVSCGDGGSGDSAGNETESAVPTSPATVEPSIPFAFVDATLSSGIAYEIGYKTYLPPDRYAAPVERAATGGVAAGDYDRDGDVDLFVTRGDIDQNLLYRNNGLGVFDEVAAAAGLAFTAEGNENYRLSGPTFADMDGDGYLDVFMGGIFGDPSKIYRNNGDGSFTDASAGSGIDRMRAMYTISSAFGDYDLDGDLDMFVSHWGTIPDPESIDDTEHLWRNDSIDGKIVFTSVSAEAGIAPSILTLNDPLETKPSDDDYTYTPTFARIDADL